MTGGDALVLALLGGPILIGALLVCQAVVVVVGRLRLLVDADPRWDQ